MKYLARVNGKLYEVDVERAPSQYQPIPRSAYTGGAPVPAPVAAPVAAPAPAPAPAPKTKAPAPKLAEGDTKIDCPMPGKILDIKVSEGQSVKSGQTLLILEAMKMENEIVSPVDAVVKKVAVQKGDMVESNDPLIILG